MNKEYARYYTYIKPILRNKQVQVFSPVVFSLLASIIFILFAIKPTLSTILSLKQTINQDQQVYAQLLQKEKNLSLAKTNMDSIPQSTLTKLDRLLPNETGVTDLTDTLASLASSNQASMSALQYQPFDLVGLPPTLNPNPSLTQISFTLSLQGDYPKITKLINDLNNSSRLIIIDSMNLTQTSAGSLTTTINARAFYLKN